MPKTTLPKLGKEKTSRVQIGFLVKRLREERAMTQEAFAQALGTSQSAVVRVEKGEQNLTLQQLQKIGTVLHRKLISFSDSVDFQVEGGRKLSGEVSTNTSKNGAMGLLAAAVLNRGKTILHGIPRIEEVFRFIEVLHSIGVSARWTDQSTLEIVPPKKFTLDGIDQAAARMMRSTLLLIGPLIHYSNSFSLPHSGGCKMGKRTIAAHRFALESLGVKIKTKEDSYEITHKKLSSREVILYESSDTAAENIIMAAARIPQTTVIKFAPPNYQVQEVCFFLEQLGVKIEGIGTTTLKVTGRADINTTVEYWNSEDPIESMLFISAAITTKSQLTIRRCPIDFLELELLKLEKMGLRYKKSPDYTSTNGRTRLTDITVFPSQLKAREDKIHPQPFPGINIDNLPFFVPIATQAKGTTLIHDWVWEDRAIYFTELNRLGAKIRLVDPHRVFIEGPTKLKGAQVVCPPALRPAVIVLIAMLAAEGTSVLRNVYPINRGYEEIAERLNGIGASIRVVKNI